MMLLFFGVYVCVCDVKIFFCFGMVCDWCD